MINQSIAKLERFCDRVPALLRKIPEAEFTSKPQPDKWSKKEIVGHLIDSATNNHHRFVKGQFENAPTILYDQNEWNKFNYYNRMDSDQLIQFWESYNRQLLELIKQIPSENLGKICNGETLEYLFIDYVAHLEYHLNQIITINT